MNFKKFSPQFYVSGQVSITDIENAAAQGIRTVICNRPENETPDQPRTSDLAAAASNLGMEFLHIPVVGGSITDADINDFADVRRNSPGPVLAYCRSGMRAAALWALTEATSLDCKEILTTARDAGYDLTGLQSRLQQRARN